MSHYYDEQPDVKSNPKELVIKLKCATRATTDAGVFQKIM